MAFLPFSLHPANWSLVGKEREEAKLRYTLSGEELDRALLELQFASPLTPLEEKEFKLKKLTLELKYRKIDTLTYDRAVAEVEFPNKKSADYKRKMLDIKYEHGEIEEDVYDLALVELNHKNKESSEYLIAKANIDLKHEKIDELEYEKTVASAKQEPWVKVIYANLDYKSEGSQIGFELDWNTYMVDDLRRHGYTGRSDAEVIDQWFTQTCQDIFNPDPEYLPDDQPIAATTKRTDLGNDKAEYS